MYQSSSYTTLMQREIIEGFGDSHSVYSVKSGLEEGKAGGRKTS